MFMLVSLVGNSQQDTLQKAPSIKTDQTQYVFDLKRNKLKSLGFYFAPEMGVSQLNKSTVPLGGGSFMFVINKKLGIGFAGQITGNPNNNNELLKLGYGGLKLEYTIKPNSKVHTTIPLIIGTGFANNDSLRYRYGSPNRPHGGGYYQDFDRKNNYSQFFVIQPGVNLEANLIRFVKIFGGLNYRLATKINDGRNVSSSTPISAGKVSGITATIGLKFGLFDYQVHRKDSLARKNKQNKYSKSH